MKFTQLCYLPVWYLKNVIFRKHGFNSVTITTNAQIPFEWVKADFVWVSLDGYREYHDNVRCNAFETGYSDCRNETEAVIWETFYISLWGR